MQGWVGRGRCGGVTAGGLIGRLVEGCGGGGAGARVGGLVEEWAEETAHTYPQTKLTPNTGDRMAKTAGGLVEVRLEVTHNLCLTRLEARARGAEAFPVTAMALSSRLGLPKAHHLYLPQALTTHNLCLTPEKGGVLGRWTTSRSWGGDPPPWVSTRTARIGTRIRVKTGTRVWVMVGGPAVCGVPLCPNFGAWRLARRLHATSGRGRNAGGGARCLGMTPRTRPRGHTHRYVV